VSTSFFFCSDCRIVGPTTVHDLTVCAIRYLFQGGLYQIEVWTSLTLTWILLSFQSAFISGHASIRKSTAGGALATIRTTNTANRTWQFLTVNYALSCASVTRSTSRGLGMRTLNNLLSTVQSFNHWMWRSKSTTRTTRNSSPVRILSVVRPLGAKRAICGLREIMSKARLWRLPLLLFPTRIRRDLTNVRIV
jgi:hypothetical protein